MPTLRDRHDCRDRCRLVERFARIPRPSLVTRLELQVASGQIVSDGVAVDVIERVCNCNVASRLADRDHQLDLMVKIIGTRRVRHRCIVGHDGIGRLGEEERRLTLGVLAHLTCVCCVIAPNAVDAMHREAIARAANFNRNRLVWSKYKAHVVDKLAWWTEDGSSLARFAPQTELFLNDPVREAEQHRLFLSLMTTSGPARHNEDIARTPLERTVSDDRTTIAFETDEHRRVGASVRTPTKVLGQQLHESGN